MSLAKGIKCTLCSKEPKNYFRDKIVIQVLGETCEMRICPECDLKIYEHGKEYWQTVVRKTATEIRENLLKIVEGAK